MALKKKLAYFLNLIGVNHILFIISLRYYGNHVRVINYHDTPESDISNFENQLVFFKKYYTPISDQDLDGFYKGTFKLYYKPGLLLSFDDGYRSNYDFAIPKLNKYGFRGWFFIPTIALLDSLEISKIQVKDVKPLNSYSDGRYLMNSIEIKEISNNHMIGSHTHTHHRMKADDKLERLVNEIIGSKLNLESHLNKPIESFCWVGGEEFTYTNNAAKMIKKAGYKYSFMTTAYPIKSNQSSLQIQRTNIEINYPLYLVKFQLGPIMDLYYWAKRKRVLKITKV